MAWTNASRAASAISAPKLPLIWTPAPMDARAAAATGAGTPSGSAWESCDAYSDDMMLPMTATPSAPPSSRVVSLTAEPMLARSGGSALMIDAVAGAPASPMPAPMSSNAIARRPYPVFVPTVAATARPIENSSIPVTTRRRVPNRTTSCEESGAKTIIAPA